VATQQKNSQLQYGLSLDRDELAALDAAGIRVEARVTPVRQGSGNLVLTCEESGGGKRELGHYVGYLPLQGLPVIVNRKVIMLGSNKLHRHIVSTAIVRFEVFRYRGNYVHVWITLHRANRRGNEAKLAPVTRETLFRRKFGEIVGETTMFPSEDGTEDISIPSFLIPGYEAALAGTRCLGKGGTGCHCAGHFMNVPHLKLPDGVLAALHIAATETTPEATPEADKKPPTPMSRTRSDRRKPIAVGDTAAD
jgi:hypothetical protein